jgi:predicted dehydrogenase
MKIGLIDSGNQAGKLLKLIKNKKDLKNIIIFHPFKKKLEIQNNYIKNLKDKKIFFTNKLDDLYVCKLVIIASSSDTHLKFIRLFIKKNILIFCEKPPATNYRDLNYLKKLPNNLKKKIIFNFHLPYSPIYKNIKKILNNKKYGKFIKINISVGHGISFKKKFIKNWRFQQKNIFSNILGNLGIHYIHLFVKLFNKIKIKDISREKYSRARNFDTAEIFFENKQNILSKVFMSYAIPYTDTIEISFTNGTVVYFKNKLDVYHPRNSFDKIGGFKLAPNENLLKISHKKNLSIGTENILDLFFKTFKNKKYFKIEEFNQAIKANQMLLDFYKK